MLSHTIKIWERVELRVRRTVSIFENQFWIHARVINNISYPTCDKTGGEISRKEEGLTFGIH